MDQRSRYLSWVYDTKIDYLPWDVKLKLIEGFLDQFKIFFCHQQFLTYQMSNYSISEKTY